ncbi:hypothetical protein [Embleya sp. NPDC050493]|uniref:hypothetical protein n=1 Tax=Embleya sp. NPDC050493 TaxID=3363989 RepID=UPI0037BD3DF4
MVLEGTWKRLGGDPEGERRAAGAGGSAPETVGFDDLVPGLPRPNIDPQLPATMDLLFDRRIETMADPIRRGESA